MRKIPYSILIFFKNLYNKSVHLKKGDYMKKHSNHLILALLFTILSRTLLSNSIQGLFNHIYDAQVWPGKESYSGPGSTLKETETIRKKIPELLREFNIKTLLDAPCGDFNWMQHVNLSYLDQYIGIDIVSDLIKKNKKIHENETHLFICANIIDDLLPQVDIILCRDCLVHLKFQDIWKTLTNMKKSRSIYLLTTTFPQVQSNHDLNKIVPQSNRGLKERVPWRPLNLQQAPFNFPKPLKLIKENCKHDKRYPDKSLGLWKIEDIKT